MNPNKSIESIESIVLSDDELKALTGAIQKRHGIDFSCYEPKSLKRRVSRAISVFRFSSVLELWTRILKDHSFIYPFMDEISVGLTSMFRDPVLWRRLSSLLAERREDSKSLKIWHAGCSSGEEVFTMGIVLQETLPGHRCSAWATDISMQAIQTAKRGEYHRMKLNEYENNYSTYHPSGSLSDYYQPLPDSAVFDKRIIEHVTFDYHNLITDPYTKMFDIIFCRNVMIYFDNAAKIKLFDKFYRALAPGGFLIIGFYDAILPLIDEKRFSVFDIDAKIFRKV